VIPLAEAQDHLRRHLGPLDHVELPLARASGAVAAAPVRALVSSPPFDNSAVDGYALGEVTGERCHIAGSVAAGEFSDEPLTPGTARRITTGAPVPPGTFAVAMQERARVIDDGAGVVFDSLPAAGENIRRAAEDFAVGDIVINESQLLGPAHLGLIAAAGYGSLSVVRQPVVGVCSTGAELVEPGAPISGGQIPDTNRIVIAALLAAAGVECVDLGRTGDEPARVRAHLAESTDRVDVIVTTGGVSVGEFDPVRAVLEGTDGARWMQVAIKPAKPFAFGTIDGVPVLGLPGNPVSAVVAFELFVRPALSLLGGGSFEMTPTRPALAAERFRRRPDGKVHYVRVRTVEQSSRDEPGSPSRVAPVAAQGSHQLAGLALADGLGVLADGDGLDVGETINVLPLRWAPRTTSRTEARR